MLPSHGPNRILLIENDTDDCEVFGWALKDVSPDLVLECCNDCIEAQGKFATFSPDMIFLDLKLPFKSGLEYLAELQETSQLRHIPIIVYSSYMNPEEIRESKRLGAKYYFEKPHSYTELVAGLKNILEERSWEKTSFEPMLLRDGAYHPIT